MIQEPVKQHIDALLASSPEVRAYVRQSLRQASVDAGEVIWFGPMESY